MARNADGVDSTGIKRKVRGRPSKKKEKITNDSSTEQEAVASFIEDLGNNLENGEELVTRKRPKRAAACSNFKEKHIKLSDGSLLVEIKKNQVEKDEIVAVQMTKLGPDDIPPCRKLVDCILHDADGNMQPFEMSEIDDIFITAVVMPLDDNLEKVKERGIKCEGFGRIESWSISGYDDGSPVIWLSTNSADYECVKPASIYRKFYDLFHEKACICVEIYRKLARSVGGNPDLSLEELLAAVLRSVGGTKSFSSGLTSRDFVISLGDFVYNQLVGLDETSGNNDVQLATLPTLVALRDKCRRRTAFNKSSNIPNGSLKIKEGDKMEVIEDEDVKLARLLQEEEDWKSMRQRRGRRAMTSQKNIYIKISEAEIANDYPLPSYYIPSVQETDEYIFFDSDSVSYLDLPKRVLNNWALYNSDSRLISLELLPMKPCTEVDVMIFGSGIMREDDGSGYFFETGSGQSSLSVSECVDNEGIPVYLSAIKEWMIEFGSSMIFISIRTDMAWYRLGKPSKKYALWYEPVLKTARLAISIITLLKEQSRASKLSFIDVIKKVAEFDKSHPAYVSSNMALVERYVVVHGQIILQQFAEYPDETIQKCAFVMRLSEKMEERHHTKLVMKKRVTMQKEANLNPNAVVKPLLSKRKVMRATTTRLINKIWGDYYSIHFPEDSKDSEAHDSKEVEEQEDTEEEEADDDSILVNEEKASTSCSFMHSGKFKPASKETKWEGEPTGKMNSGEALYKCAFVHGHWVAVGRAAIVEANELSEVPAILFLEYMFEKHDGTKMLHGRVMQKGLETILGNAADEREVFLTNNCMEIELGYIREPVSVEIQSRQWGHKFRKEYANADKIDRGKAEERKKKGLPVEFYCKSLYWPERGGFFTLPYKSLGLGTGVCDSCEQKVSQQDEFLISSKTCFIYKKSEYNVHDFLYIRPQFFAKEKEEDRGTHKAGRNVGLKAFVVCHLLEIQTSLGCKEPTPKSTQVRVGRFYRPEDVSTTKGYSSDIREVYYSEEVLMVPVEMIEGKCVVRRKIDFPNMELPVIMDHVFFCEYAYDPVKGSLKQLPANVKLISLRKHTASSASKRLKGKEKCKENMQDDSDQQKGLHKENCLATLDIFAGCGGLSEGLQKSGVSFTKWAIEYEQPAGEAFSVNHPEALVFIDNCNVILRAIMERCGDADDCNSTPEAAELAAAFDDEKIKNLPVPGEVDFINGGPPCQGFSGMNRFNQSTWSKVQCEMILAFLSFAEYFRPRYFLLENVRNFVSFNKGQTFRLTLASLLAMGYQVRFGILEAGAYGVSQSRKRALIWAASPDETLPEWPEPMHVFAGSELRISMPCGVHYAAVKSTAGGAPFRSITVRDTIGDLPPVQNGASKSPIDYGSEPTSWFQKQIRGNTMVLNDHISKEMNELNLVRCQHIPKRAGADWHDLPDEKVKLSSGQTVDLIPWCLPNTAKRHNQWKGLFGRLDWEGNFPTSITDPQPMGKVGMCFHPEQDRIITVRECARSQGFPDGYRFSGSIQNKHRQIGNAVPPPLAYALGRKLKEAVESKRP
nr:PREDICTED: DNA (cytosine-5)-methyltransferase 1B-like [Musa acuminata subsp. malaccensis]